MRLTCAAPDAHREGRQWTGAATGAATWRPISARWNCSQTVDLRQQPLPTIVRRVHTEVIVCSTQRVTARGDQYRVEALAVAVRTVTVTGLGHMPVSVAIGSAADGPTPLSNISGDLARNRRKPGRAGVTRS
jgi:hypothetical protein